VGRPIKIAKSASVGTGFQGSLGVVGGNTSITGNQIACRVKIGANAEADGFIIRQKGARKFLVSDGTNTGVCVLANTADTTLADSTMTVTVTLADTSTVRLARLSSHNGIDFSGNGYLLTFGSADAAPAGSSFPIASVNKF
jgi:hypothetical protein